ncbi:MAG: protein-export membrane protein SecF [Candidatus Magasanikbacteria bacterium RIFCSPHIGHO2_01_FULL_47_8]|uniref:Protein-export membrane protein SecF n=1 Tax=Candidatus Magasanikbacteria bacterium RIFCSPHIGHO2_01_FULL_47_8 TaxID=1798673 RepID=A0A1F6ME62_9BACT|nr:MAG: protein-export membrane protein SecF [Candidatus Magasanikbacteria bacterium RIFCSPHIGHO2_01_FULL_47_8]
MKVPFIKYSKVWLAIGVITAVAGLAALVGWGFKYGIDFTGGSLMELRFTANRPAVAEVQEVFAEHDLANALVQTSGAENAIIRTAFLTEAKHQEILTALRKRFEKESQTIREERFETIGAAVSKQLRERSLWALILVSLSIIAYVAIAFRKISRPIASWKYGTIAIVTLLYVVIVVSGIFAALGRWRGVEVDIAFVVAILTVLGYSVNDSIVVYDRIRENLLRHRIDNFGELVNTGLNETLARSVNTVFAVLLPLVALYFFGGPTIHYFALALILGMAMSTWASIFIASPLLVLVERWQRK